MMKSYENGSNDTLLLSLFPEKDSILVSSAVLTALEHPRLLQVLINEEQKMLLLQACTVDDREAVIVPPSPLSAFEMSGHSLLKRIRRLIGWTDSIPRGIHGKCLPSHRAVVFDLCSACPPQIRPPDGNTARPC